MAVSARPIFAQQRPPGHLSWEGILRVGRSGPGEPCASAELYPFLEGMRVVPSDTRPEFANDVFVEMVFERKDGAWAWQSPEWVADEMASRPVIVRPGDLFAPEAG